jgi:hypothetical protein
MAVDPTSNPTPAKARTLQERGCPMLLQVDVALKGWALIIEAIMQIASTSNYYHYHSRY